MRTFATIVVALSCLYGRVAIGQTDAAALMESAHAYSIGKGVAQDYEQAAALYQEATDLGYAPAAHQLGLMYADGRGVPQDEFKAIDLYRMAIAQSYVPAMTSLGMAYAEGRGVSRDPATAKALLEKAATAGDRRAKDYLARAKWAP